MHVFSSKLITQGKIGPPVIFAGKLIYLVLSRSTVCSALSLVLWAKQGQQYHCSNQREKLYLWMEN
jgi:hypothetical protein